MTGDREETDKSRAAREMRSRAARSTKDLGSREGAWAGMLRYLRSEAYRVRRASAKDDDKPPARG